MSNENWQHYSTTATKRKRADLVCTACHAKKIKCDLQQQRKHGRQSCRNCSTVDRACEIRPSKREKKRKSKHDGVSLGSDHDVHSISNGVDALLAADATFHTMAEEHMTRNLDSLSEARVLHPSANTTHEHTMGYTFRNDLSPQDVPRAVPMHNSPATVSRRVPSTNLTDTTPTQSGDVDSGFLQVYAPENRFDAESQALVAQLEHRYCSDLNPDLESIFTETYFEYCYTWCPVLDATTLASEVARSPLLANALALASSHIQPPLLPHDGPDVYYKRARTIFYDDEESDEFMTLKALCLFYWWAPQSPSRVHRHSYVCTPRKIAR